MHIGRFTQPDKSFSFFIQKQKEDNIICGYDMDINIINMYSS